jgi:hypothetical protein
MVLGFSPSEEYEKVVGWELYQVTVDKYHVMFWFENGHALLNIADRFSYRSADRRIEYTYEIYGTAKSLQIDRILRVPIKWIAIASERQLELRFANGDVLTVHDNPEFRSWWFMKFSHDSQSPRPSLTVWKLGDEDPS